MLFVVVMLVVRGVFMVELMNVLRHCFSVTPECKINERGGVIDKWGVNFVSKIDKWEIQIISGKDQNIPEKGCFCDN